MCQLYLPENVGEFMAVKVSDKITADGRKFQKMLKEICELEVRVGFQHGKKYEEEPETDICDVAMWNELGTVNMPSRPFLRKSVDENENKIKAFIRQMKKDLISGVPASQVFKKIGIFQKDLIQNKIKDGDFAPNAPATVKKKRSGRPLIDTGQMRQSVDYVIQKKSKEG